MRWLPLYVHLQDTMLFAGNFWDSCLSNGEKEAIAAQMTDRDKKTVDVKIARKTLIFLCGVHDIGKATPAFQIGKAVENTTINDYLLGKLEQAGFYGAKKLKITDLNKTPHQIMGAVILNSLGYSKDITSVVAAHHGTTMHSATTYQQMSHYPTHYYQKRDKDVCVLWKRVQEEICDQALHYSGFSKKEDLPRLSQLAQVQMAGLLIVADWMSSNSDLFPLLPLDQNSISDMELRAKQGFKDFYRNPMLKLDQPENADKLFMSRFGFSPRPFQKTIFNTITNASCGGNKPGLVIIEAPTGGGKTEAALAVAEQLAACYHVNGLFFGLPTQATANSVFERVDRWLQNLTKTFGTPQSLKLYHGKAMLNHRMLELSKKDHPDIDSNDNVFSNPWFSRSKLIALDSCVVGTIDQFLRVACKQKHLMLRHLGFAEKVVILDEVHAYDAYMQQYLTMALKWMGAYQVPVILLSATLPSGLREKFVHAYINGLSDASDNHELPRLTATAYPLLTYTIGTKVYQHTDFEQPQQKEISIEKISSEEAECEEKAEELFNDGCVVGIIVNTVARSQCIASHLANKCGSENVHLLHSSFIAADKSQKENLLMQLTGSSNERKPAIIVGTQVLEQSLDIDFDVLLTDFCPMDLLIQRLGRLHRHADTIRPSLHQKPVAYVMGAADSSFDKGTTYIYKEYILMRTKHYLKNKIVVPRDVAPLVQGVYGFTDQDSEDNVCGFADDHEDKARIRKAFIDMKSSQEEQERNANKFKLKDPQSEIDPSESENTLIGWLDGIDPAQHASVRDIKETFEVVALRKYGDDYGFFVPQSDAETHLASVDFANDYNTALKIAEQTLRLPLRISYKLTAESLKQYTQMHFSEWCKQGCLKNAYGLLFDEDGNLIDEDDTLGLQKEHVRIYYDVSLGLCCEKSC